MAGVSASRAGGQLLHGRREPRAPDSARDAGESAMTASTRGRWKANRISGSDRRARGRTSNDSSSLTGPRRSGCSAESTRLRPDATLSRPSSVRTAHAQDVGPCTSTPFSSAIPPSRIFFSPTRGQASYAAPTDSAAWRRKSTPSSTSEIAARSSAEWTSLDASSALHLLASGRTRRQPCRTPREASGCR